MSKRSLVAFTLILAIVSIAVVWCNLADNPRVAQAKLDEPQISLETQTKSFAPVISPVWLEQTSARPSITFEEDNSDRQEEADSRKEEADSIKSDVEDLSWKIRKLRSNASFYSADDFAYKLKKLAREAEDLSSRASDIEADDAVNTLDNVQKNISRVRRDIESNPRYFYGQRDYDIESRLRRTEWDTDSAGNDLDNYIEAQEE